MIDLITRCNSCTHIVVCSKRERFKSIKDDLENASFGTGDEVSMPFKDSKDVIITIKCPFYSEVPSRITAIKEALGASNSQTI